MHTNDRVSEVEECGMQPRHAESMHARKFWPCRVFLFTTATLTKVAINSKIGKPFVATVRIAVIPIELV